MLDRNYGATTQAVVSAVWPVPNDIEPIAARAAARDMSIGIARAGTERPILDIQMFLGLPEVEELQNNTLQECHHSKTTRLDVISRQAFEFLVSLHPVANANGVRTVNGRSVIGRNGLILVIKVYPCIEQLLAGGNGRGERLIAKFLGNGNRPVETFGFGRENDIRKINRKTKDFLIELGTLVNESLLLSSESLLLGTVFADIHE